MSTAYDEIEPIFPTLRSAGYHSCAHPRTEGDVCADCGAVHQGATWIGGHLESRRRIIHMERPR